MTELKPCPFCGGEAGVFEASPEDNGHLLSRHFSVYCKECKAMIGTVVQTRTDFFDTPEEAVAAWNTRAERVRQLVDIVGGWFACSECGTNYLSMPDAVFCPDCGARLEREDER